MALITWTDTLSVNIKDIDALLSQVLRLGA